MGSIRRVVPGAVLVGSLLAIALGGSPGVAQPAQVAAASVTATSAASAVSTITIDAVGDICFASAPGRLIASKGPKAPFSGVASLLRKADVTLGNLECALSHRGSAVAPKAYTFRGDPKAVQGLTWAGFDVVSLANNHACDYGTTALLDTIGYLNKAKIAHAGAGKNRAKAFAPAVFRSKEATVGFLSFCQIGPASFAAGTSKAGTAYTLDLKAVKRAIQDARKSANYVIVSFHWGIEKKYTPTARQVQFGRASIDAGADLVLSEHPHVIQGVEFYHHKLIAYSLGNFVFSPGSAAGRDSMILSVTIGPHGVASVTARPAYIGSSGAPTLAKGATAKRILALIAKTSRGRKSHVSVKGTVATIKP